eukprot:391821_1
MGSANCDHYSIKNNVVKEENNENNLIVNDLTEFISHDEYDTDCVCFDVNIYDEDKQCNILRVIDKDDDEQPFESTVIELMNSGFSKSEAESAISQSYSEKNKNNGLQCIRLIKNLIKYKNISSNSFCTGFSWFYHPYYKHINHEKEQEIKNVKRHPNANNNNENDFNGVPVVDLCVAPHFNPIKTEALSSGYISLTQFTKKVAGKADNY